MDCLLTMNLARKNLKNRIKMHEKYLQLDDAAKSSLFWRLDRLEAEVGI